MKYTLKKQQDGAQKLIYRGETKVYSGYSRRSPKRKRTIGEICLNSNGMVTISTRKGSRMPDYSDTIEAIEVLISNFGKATEKREDIKVRRWTTEEGAKYVGLDLNQLAKKKDPKAKWENPLYQKERMCWIGRNGYNKFSLRGKREIPLEVLILLLPELKNFLTKP